MPSEGTQLIERLEYDRKRAMARARRLEPNPGSGEASMRGPGAYDRGIAYGLSLAINRLKSDAT